MSLSFALEIKKKRSDILRIASHYGATNLRLFGSVLRGEERPDSDVDFLVKLERGRSLFDRIGLVHDLESLLGRKVDVVSEDALHWYIRDKILSEAKPL